MKILMVTDKMGIGGAETHIKMLTEQLIDAGHSVTLVSAGGVFSDKLSKKGCRCIEAPLDKRTPSAILKAARILKKELRLCDVAHSHSRFTSTLLCKLRGKGKFPPLISTAHLPFSLSPITRHTKWGDKTLAVSSDIREYLIESYGIEPQNIILTKNGINTLEFNGTPSSEGYIVHVSRLDEGRSLTAKLLCKIAPTLLSEYPEYKILIVGDGDQAEEIQALAKNANIALGFAGVLLTGGTGDVLPYLLKGDVFIGVSRAALEAMAIGLPTIISGDEGFGGIVSEEKITELEAGNLCARGFDKPCEEKLLCELRRLFDNSDLKKRTASLCKRLVLEGWRAEGTLEDASVAYISAKTPPRVCLLGYFGYKNFGDEATLKIAISHLRSRGVKVINVLMRRGGESDVSGVERYDRFSMTDIKRALSSSDILVLCGGNLIQNVTSKRSLFYYSAVISAADAMNKRIIALSSGFGEMVGKRGMCELDRILAAFDFIGARTSEDRRNAELHSTCEVRLMPDLCFLYKRCAFTAKKDFFVIIPSKNSSMDAEFISRLSRETALRPLTVLLNEEEDRKAAAELSDALSIECVTAVNADALIALLSSAHFSISERLHGGIFSLISHTVCYLSEKSHKSRALITEISERCEKLYLSSPLLPLSRLGEEYPSTDALSDEDFTHLLSTLEEEVRLNLDALFGEEIN